MRDQEELIRKEKQAKLGHAIQKILEKLHIEEEGLEILELMDSKVSPPNNIKSK